MIGRVGWPVLALALLLAVLVAAGIPLGLRWIDARAEEERYDEVLAAARAEALAFTTIDYQTIDEDIDRVLDGATGDFKRQFSASRAEVKEVTTEAESVSTGEVLSAGVVAADEDSATAIVVADSTIVNVNVNGPQPRHYRISMDLVRVEDRWLTSKLEFVG